MSGNSGHVDRDVKELSYRDYIKARFANAVVLAREMEKAIGTEKAHAIIRDAFFNDMTDMVKTELVLSPVNEFADFVRLEKEENEQPNFRNIVELTYPHGSETELSLNVSRCLFAEVFKELDAVELGYLMVCNPDHAYAQTSHPRIKLRRSMTLMEGHECCDHTWYWDADEEP
jgi:hypothetical protein